MKLLAIDTSSSACSIALFFLDGEIKLLHQHAPLLQAQQILPLLDQLLKIENISLNQLDAIAFGCGPGSFTGVRIATSIAQGLGFALQIPLIPISSLAALAQSAYATLGWRNLFVAIDARIQEIYCAHYTINSDGLAELYDKEIVCSPELAPKVEHKITDWYGVGNAWQTYHDQLDLKLIKIDANLQLTAAAILQLAIPQFKNQRWLTADKALPVYLRDKVATKQKER